MTVETHSWICGAVVPIDGSEMRHITIYSVGQALAWQHRFNGQFGPASLADHCWRVSQRLPEKLRLAGLFHDVGEIVTGDIAAPLKARCPDLVALEKRWKGLLTLHLLGEDLGLQTIEDMTHHLVKESDMLDYADEVRWYTSRGRPKHPIPPYDAAASAARWVGAVRAEIVRRLESPRFH